MDRTYVDNGCMWFVPRSHREPELRESRRVRPGVHVRTCDGSEVYCTLVFPNVLIIFLCYKDRYLIFNFLSLFLIWCLIRFDFASAFSCLWTLNTEFNNHTCSWRAEYMNTMNSLSSNLSDVLDSHNKYVSRVGFIYCSLHLSLSVNLTVFC